MRYASVVRETGCVGVLLIDMYLASIMDRYYGGPVGFYSDTLF